MLDFKVLHEMQAILDRNINDSFGISGYEVVEERTLALLVEIGELANETRCFKFWSRKAPSQKSVILEELVDCMHFLLSIGNHSGYDFEFDVHHVDLNEDIKGSKSELFVGFFHKVVEFRNYPSPARYVQMWDYLMSIAKKLEFTRDEMYNGYVIKNKINHQRQAEGY